jgi:hypothetical protein
MLPSTTLDWTVAPQVFFGYRLPTGFGEVALSYRGMGTKGNGTTMLDGPATLRSRLDFNIFGLDYVSREYSLWPQFDLRWSFGLRLTTLYFDSRADQPFDQAAAGSGDMEQHETNHLLGIGPHVGLKLARRVRDSGVSMVARVEFTGSFSTIHQGFNTLSTNADASGQPLVGTTITHNHMGTQLFESQLGVGWQPPSLPNANLFVGWQYLYWWRVGTNLDTAPAGPFGRGSIADIWSNGVVLQGAYRF